jgi:hypothetical protein
MNWLGAGHKRISVKPLKPKLVEIIFKNSVRTSKRTPHFTITKIKLLTLFKEIIALYRQNHTRTTKAKSRLTDFTSQVVQIVSTRL